jgi:hypothetical protein
VANESGLALDQERGVPRGYDAYQVCEPAEPARRAKAGLLLALKARLRRRPAQLIKR